MQPALRVKVPPPPLLALVMAIASPAVSQPTTVSAWLAAARLASRPRSPYSRVTRLLREIEPQFEGQSRP